MDLRDAARLNTALVATQPHTVQPPPALGADQPPIVEEASDLLVYEAEVKRQKSAFGLPELLHAHNLTPHQNVVAVQHPASVSAQQMVMASLQAQTALHAGLSNLSTGLQTVAAGFEIAVPGSYLVCCAAVAGGDPASQAILNRLDVLVTKIDQVRDEVGQVRDEVGQVKAELGQVKEEVGLLTAAAGNMEVRLYNSHAGQGAHQVKRLSKEATRGRGSKPRYIIANSDSELEEDPPGRIFPNTKAAANSLTAGQLSALAAFYDKPAWTLQGVRTVAQARAKFLSWAGIAN